MATLMDVLALDIKDDPDSLKKMIKTAEDMGGYELSRLKEQKIFLLVVLCVGPLLWVYLLNWMTVHVLNHLCFNDAALLGLFLALLFFGVTCFLLRMAYYDLLKTMFIMKIVSRVYTIKNHTYNTDADDLFKKVNKTLDIYWREQ